MNLIELRQQLADLEHAATTFYTLVDENVIPYDDAYIRELDAMREVVENAIADEESANEEALYWESLELSI